MKDKNNKENIENFKSDSLFEDFANDGSLDAKNRQLKEYEEAINQCLSLDDDENISQNEESADNLSDSESKSFDSGIKPHAHEKVFFAHVVNPLRSNNDNLINKVTGVSNKNINATMVIKNLAINTYANTDWKGSSVIMINDKIKFLGFFPSDIGSDQYKFKSYIPEEGVMDDIEMWNKGYGNKYNINYRYSRMKPTIDSAIVKIKEISSRKIGEIADESDIKYLDDKSNQILATGMTNKYTGKGANFDGINNIPIKQHELKHNECHIKINLANVKGVAVTKEDFENQKNIDQKIRIYSAIKKLDLVNEKRVQTINSDEYLNQIIDSEIEKMDFLRKKIGFLQKKLSEHEKNLQDLEGNNYDKNDDIKYLKIAFASKITKNKNFVPSKENKKIWLEANIRKIQSFIDDEQREYSYYKALGEVDNGNDENDEYDKNIIKERIINILKGAIYFSIYDKEQGIFIKLHDYLKSKNSIENEDPKLVKRESKYKDYINDLSLLKSSLFNGILDQEKDKKFLYNLIINEFDNNEIDQLFFSNPNISDANKKENLNFVDGEKNNIFHMASQFNNFDITKLENSSKINDFNQSGYRPIHLAALNNNLSATQYFINEGKIKILTSQDIHGRNPLHIAIKGGSLDIVQYILQELDKAENKNFFTKINSKDYAGYFPLHFAVFFNQLEILELLLKENDKGKNPKKNLHINLKSDSGVTLLHTAVSRENGKMVDFLISKGADVNILNKDKQSPIYNAIENNYHEILEKLLNAGCNINNPDLNKRTPIHLAAKQKEPESLLLLLGKNDANLDAQDYENATPLHRAVKKGLYDNVKIILDKKLIMGKDETAYYINLKTFTNKAPLHLAAQNGDIKIAKLLIENGANIDSGKRSDKPYPLRIAMNYEQKEMINFLVSCGCSLDLNRMILSENSSNFGYELVKPYKKVIKEVENITDPSKLSFGKKPREFNLDDYNELEKKYKSDVLNAALSNLLMKERDDNQKKSYEMMTIDVFDLVNKYSTEKYGLNLRSLLKLPAKEDFSSIHPSTSSNPLNAYQINSPKGKDRIL